MCIKNNIAIINKQLFPIFIINIRHIIYTHIINYIAYKLNHILKYVLYITENTQMS